jgi:hypothetical protein
VFSYDSLLRILLTRDRLNLLGAPTVTVNLASKINSDGDDIKDGTVDEAMLAAALGDRLITAVATVAAESSNNVDVSIQFRDCQGNALAGYCAAEIWLNADGSTLTPAALPSGGAPAILTSNGFILRAMTSTASGLYISDSAGLLKLRFTEAGALTKYLGMIVQGKYVAGSAALIWTA